MARIRTIKPSFFSHHELYQAELETGLPLRVAYAGLWTQADRDGRFRWCAPELKLGCLPYDGVDFSRVLHALETRGFIVKYGSNGRVFGFIPSFSEHQVINNREAPSTLPEPNENNILTREARVDDASLTALSVAQGEGKGREGKGRSIKPPPESRESRAKTLPTDFKPKDSHETLAAELGVHLETEFPHFADHHKGKGSTMKDWDAALNTWLRNAAKFSKGGKRHDLHDKRAETIAALTSGGAIAGTAVRVD